jgi:hypothetical protein
MWRARTKRVGARQHIELNPEARGNSERISVDAQVVGVDGARLTLVPVSRTLFVAVPSSLRRRRTSNARWVSEAIRMGIFYPDVQRQPAYVRREAKGTPTRYMLSPPPPELVALGLVMFQGIVQGATWEGFKAVARKARSVLWPVTARSGGLTGSRRRSVVLGLEWTVTRPTDGRMKKLFVGLKTYEERYDHNRAKVNRFVRQFFAGEVRREARGRRRQSGAIRRRRKRATRGRRERE